MWLYKDVVQWSVTGAISKTKLSAQVIQLEHDA